MSDSAKREPAAEEEVHHEGAATPHEEKASDVENHSGEDTEGSPKKMDKYDRSGPHPIVGLIIFLIAQFVALLLMTVATPIEMYELNDQYRDTIYPELAGTHQTVCVTAWGMKRGCRSLGYYNRDFTGSFCYRVRVNFKVVEAFCIMAIGFMAIALITCIFSIFQKVGKGGVGALGVFAAMLGIIPWGVLAGMYHQKPCCEIVNWYTNSQGWVCTLGTTTLSHDAAPTFKDMGKYSAGFGLIVAAWAIQVIGCVFAFLPF